MLTKINSIVKSITTTITGLIIKKKVSKITGLFTESIALYINTIQHIAYHANDIMTTVAIDIEEHPETYTRIAQATETAVNSITDEISTLIAVIASEKETLQHTAKKIKEMNIDFNTTGEKLGEKVVELRSSITKLFKEINS